MVEIFQQNEYQSCAIHFLKCDSPQRPRSLEPTFSDATDCRYLTASQLKDFWQGNPDANNVRKDLEIRSTLEVILPCVRGDWLKAVPTLIDAGVTMISVLLPSDQDESQNANRFSLPVPEHEVIFVPNFKCGYSSLKQYIAMLSYNTDPESVERGLIDLATTRTNIKLISIVRNPLQRYLSFYHDRIQRSQNNQHYAKPIEYLYSGSALIAGSKMIGSIPDEYRDPHFKSQAGNLYLNGKCLVDKWYKLEEISDNFPSQVGLPGKLPHMHKTNKSPLPRIGEEMMQDLGVLLAKTYHDDYVTFGYEEH